ncbi:hypothetical protein SAMN06265173_1733 [Thalassovita litoralis]|jgi:hypothetical protein|uniref:Uncharacterized protein n=1 Tax=Thalassovita litoralis TaxID=1010611 RepID=A0A521FVG3_9RHOB|nr:hypothetical protein [Thalassovita litoralis]SMP00132.1 hypothetical protein SAMN06265173_1733 [Thalassovita litoralis]
MGVTLTTAARNAAVDAIADLVDAGTSDANGDLVIMTAGDVEVATLALSNPGFAAASGGAAAADTISDDTNATGGTAALFKLQDRDNTEVLRGTVGTSGADLNLSSLTIGAGDTVSVSSLTISQPAT